MWRNPLRFEQLVEKDRGEMVATLDVHVEVRADGWQWGHWGSASEYVYTRPELLKVLRTYGLWASRMTRGAHIRITTRGRFSGRVCAQWEWSGGQPLGDPWVYWPRWENLVFSAQLHVPYYTEHDENPLVSTGPTDVSTLRLAPVVDPPPLVDSGPHVRHREDVPHEGSLPDLYGLWRRGA